MEKEEMEESDMSNSSLNATEIAVGSLLARGGGGGGYGGGGGGAWGGGYGGHAPWAGPGSNAARINRNLHAIDKEGDFDRFATNLGFNNLSDKFNDQNRHEDRTQLLQAGFQSELRTNDRLRDISDRMAENSAEVAKCCCETQLAFKDQALKQQECCCETQKLVQADGQKTRDLINERALMQVTDTNNINATVGPIVGAGNANTAAIIQAIQSLNHHGGH